MLAHHKIKIIAEITGVAHRRPTCISGNPEAGANGYPIKSAMTDCIFTAKGKRGLHPLFSTHHHSCYSSFVLLFLAFLAPFGFAVLALALVFGFSKSSTSICLDSISGASGNLISSSPFS